MGVYVKHTLLMFVLISSNACVDHWYCKDDPRCIVWTSYNTWNSMIQNMLANTHLISQYVVLNVLLNVLHSCIPAVCYYLNDI